MARPMLGDLELEQVQLVETGGDQVITHHPVPGLDGGFLQCLGRRGTRLRLAGVLTRPDTAESLAELRSRFHAAEPVAFVSDISTATLVDRVLIEEMEVRELAGRPSVFEYSFALREFIEPEPVDTEDVTIPPPPPPDVENGKLSVTVVAEGEPGFDMDRVRVTVRGTEEWTGAELNRVLTTRTSANVWFEEPFPAGQYTVEALVDDNRTPTGEHEVLSGAATVQARGGQTASVTSVLRRGGQIGTVFVITFHFDKAFIEPCMRHVLRQVATYAQGHPGERMLCVGHTDLGGSSTYNQALSERRARATYAMLTFGSNPQASVNEWNELRQARPAGEIDTVKDTWGTREYQHMLQDLGYFLGNVGKDPELTDDAVRRFQRDHTLTDNGVVDDGTWLVLIEEYLSKDPIDVPVAQFMANANTQGCNQGPLRWLGCGEQDPVRNTEKAWRPNRRTELMFVHEPAMPCQVPKPVTLDLVPDGAGGGGWCLDDGTATTVNCFVTPAGKPCRGGPSQAWCRIPAEPGSFAVKGTIIFGNGTPFKNGKYVLTAPDGQYMDGEVATTTSTVHAGTPIQGRTKRDGRFTYHTRKGPGTYVVEVDGPFLARMRDQPLATATGNAVCFRLDGSKDAEIVIVDPIVATIQPSITAPSVVVVRKPHTNPARQPVVLRALTAFTGSGTFTRSSGRVRFFDAVAGGSEITFNGTDNVFTDAQLVAGHTVFADGFLASAAVGDVTLTLGLTVNGTPGLSSTESMTAVELTLDVGLSRPAPGAAPPMMPPADKVNPGRPVQAQDGFLNAERVVLVVQPLRPAAFVGQLSVSPLDGRVRLMTGERPAPGDVPFPTPHVVASGGIPPGGLELFIEGVTASATAHDSGFQLGLVGVEPDGDRVAVTVIQVEATTVATAAAPAITSVQAGLWDNAFDPMTGALRNGALPADSFVDLDTRKFYVRLRDASRARTATVDWRTEFDDGTVDDHRPPPQSDELTVTETGAGSRVFISQAVMLVTDEDDRRQAVDSGLPAGNPATGSRQFGDSDHRLRKITVTDAHPLTSQVVVTYPVMAGVKPFMLRLPVFERNPEERRRIRVHLIDVRDRPGGAGTLTVARRGLIQRVFRAAYARCGIDVDFLETALDPPAAAANWIATFPADPLAIDPSVESFSLPGANLRASASQRSLIDAVRALPLFTQSDLYVIVVQRIYRTPLPAPPGPGLRAGARGQSFPDSFLAAGSRLRSFTFVGVRNGPTDYTETHEATHLTTDLRNSVGGHFDLGAADRTDDRNLMRDGTLDGNGVLDTKRLWNRIFNNPAINPADIPAQIDTIRGSRWVRPY